MKIKLLFLGLFFLLANQGLHAQEDTASDEELEAMIEQFFEEFAYIVDDYPNNFANIKGEKIPDEAEYNSKIQLVFAEECYLSPAFLSSNLTFVADFGEYASQEEAMNVFENVSILVENTTFPFSLVGDESGDENIYTRYWIPFVLDTETVNPAFSQMSITVRYFKMPSFLTENPTPHSVVLNIAII